MYILFFSSFALSYIIYLKLLCSNSLSLVLYTILFYFFSTNTFNLMDCFYNTFLKRNKNFFFNLFFHILQFLNFCCFVLVYCSIPNLKYAYINLIKIKEISKKLLTDKRIHKTFILFSWAVFLLINIFSLKCSAKKKK